MLFQHRKRAWNCSYSAAAYICYCEHQNERAPLNGIMCGDPTTGKFERTNYCRSNERCTGPSSASEGIDATIKEQLCEVGKFRYWILFDEGLIINWVRLK